MEKRRVAETLEWAGERDERDDEIGRLRHALAETEARLAHALRVVDTLEACVAFEAKTQWEIYRDHLRRLSTLALRDGLTGLYTRRYFDDALKDRIDLCRRLSVPLSLLFIDVDHFKRYNDRAGHAAGDVLLRRIGRLLDAETGGEASGRRSDVAARIGGEEFVMLLLGADADGARTCAERIRRRIAANLSPPRSLLSTGPVTVTIGTATFPDDAKSGADLLRQADAALLAGKRAGRNRTRTAGRREP